MMKGNSVPGLEKYCFPKPAQDYPRAGTIVMCSPSRKQPSHSIGSDLGDLKKLRGQAERYEILIVYF